MDRPPSDLAADYSVTVDGMVDGVPTGFTIRSALTFVERFPHLGLIGSDPPDLDGASAESSGG